MLAVATTSCLPTPPSAEAPEAVLPSQPPAPAAAVVPIQGRLLIATTRLSPRPRSDLAVDRRLAWLSRAGLEPIRLPGEEEGVGDGAVSPDGSEIAVIVGGSRVLRLGPRGSLLGDLAPTLGPVTVSKPEQYLSIAGMGPGRYLLRQTAPMGLQVVEVAGGSRQQLPGKGLNPSVSPDGSRLALGYVREELFYSIHVADLAFSDVRKLTPDEVTEAAAAWSPDGQWIAYAANAGFADSPQPTVAWELRVIRPDGTGQRTLVPRLPGVSYSEIRWAPDSQQIAFTRVPPASSGQAVAGARRQDAAGTRQIGVVGLLIGQERMLSDGHASDRVLGWVF